ncbi:hemin-degrading factor [Aureimonas pseudogalii]|uniref:Putative hemin transport protein n=1 Tax=Aureimonas pseudogalii TaxID=1744844 RepID=A0A7W6H8K1_9HYPH|nr:ChuX/HutX family heme-like substrate-binding protein [Aureimonas pseudogalii]MBB4000610.1 putative hemin transport protein [Aureimonas pseudogalii]
MDTPLAPERPLPYYARSNRPRDLAEELGLAEASLLARHDGSEVVRLRPEKAALLGALPALGEVLSLMRNEVAVHETVGQFGGITIEGSSALVVNPPLDMRLFLGQWRHAFAVEIPDEAGPRRSVQVFDAAGDAILKVHLRATSDVAAFETLRGALASEDGAPLAVSPRPCAPDPGRPADPDAFRRDVAGMADIHEFFAILRRHGLDRRSALDAMDEAHVRPLETLATTRLLEASAASGVPVMCFVGNRGGIQIRSGPITSALAMGPWINAMEPGFTLHFREDLVGDAFVVRKPTRFGLLTSIELYAADRTLAAQFFGVREPGRGENLAWREMTGTL